MLKPNKPQRIALAVASAIIGLGTASLVYNNGFEGFTWIVGVLVSVTLLMISLISLDDNKQSLVNYNPSTIENNGTSKERAWIIIAKNSAEGIPKEYSVMSKLFGKANADWKILNRNIINNGSKTIEHFILSTKTGRKEIYFDITSFIGSNKSFSDGIPLPRNDPAFNRVVSITFIPKDAFDLHQFINHIKDSKKAKEFFESKDIEDLDKAFSNRFRREDKNEITVKLHQFTAIKLGVCLEMMRKDTKDLHVQNWADNCTGAIKHALRS